MNLCCEDAEALSPGGSEVVEIVLGYGLPS